MKTTNQNELLQSKLIKESKDSIILFASRANRSSHETQAFMLASSLKALRHGLIYNDMSYTARSVMPMLQAHGSKAQRDSFTVCVGMLGYALVKNDDKQTKTSKPFLVAKSPNYVEPDKALVDSILTANAELIEIISSIEQQKPFGKLIASIKINPLLDYVPKKEKKTETVDPTSVELPSETKPSESTETENGTIDWHKIALNRFGMIKTVSKRAQQWHNKALELADDLSEREHHVNELTNRIADLEKALNQAMAELDSKQSRKATKKVAQA